MAKKIFKITQEQYQRALEEGITLSADVTATGGDVNKAVENVRQAATKDGVDLSNATIQIPGRRNESCFVSKNKISEEAMRQLKKNSKVYTFDEFKSMLRKNLTIHDNH